LTAAGLEPDKAAVVAGILVEGDLLGHSTHGLALLAPYVRELEADRMAKSGSWDTVADNGFCATWDGRRLPGPWLVEQAIGEATGRAHQLGTSTLVIRRSHHIACLSAYLRTVTEQNLMIVLASSDPAAASVAPYGSTRRLYSPNPLAAGIPTQGDPILLDVSMSLTTNGFVTRADANGQRLPHPWVLDGAGNPTDDPQAFVRDPRGSLLPLGGLETGHKGFALGLLLEALTSALGGYGRSDGETGWGAAVFLMILDPAKFGGVEAFVREADFTATESRTAEPRVEGVPVRLPGERGLALRREQIATGLDLLPNIRADLGALALRLGIPGPD
jgi:LDH2 family malate/lactate/ureidoglycolate dehydrogenase